MFPEKITAGKNNFVISWSDGAISEIKYANLRALCPCASCRAEAENNGKNYIPIYSEAEITVDRIEPVGNYALKIIWKDGHDTGIYEFNYLTKIAGLKT
ncbi:hypothetical protein MROS_2431 [Melioribacter roseus P3M-2]|uniref:Gamma-butyrobetaine hydroxylase-like N-terminal domain-containing protein n=1 Tax=Melioribacter roseus (strain DSM 23840 / JCM 17771 / VKM B-2668 / P3M-2) TaxID=1191523 RepID=I7A704_MELRP|nr:DUF971 domain-containing protein [Melioribacter roseus]AFN75661.1 hypothetical protein MROS_2431 [Melioribacter roseus P3M-2]